MTAEQSSVIAALFQVEKADFEKQVEVAKVKVSSNLYITVMPSAYLDKGGVWCPYVDIQAYWIF